MADITNWINQIASAVWGRDVRSSIINALTAMNHEIIDETESAKVYAQQANGHSARAGSYAEDAHNWANIAGQIEGGSNFSFEDLIDGYEGVVPVSIKGFDCNDNQKVAGNGTHDDTTGFQNAFASGKKISIPTGSYKLTSPLWSDDSVVLENKGTFPNKPLIISKALRDDAIIEHFYGRFDSKWGKLNDSSIVDIYRLQGACYVNYGNNSYRRIVLSYATDPADNNDSTDLILIAYNPDTLAPIASLKIPGGGHGNSLCYVPTTDRLYFCTGNGPIANQIGYVRGTFTGSTTSSSSINPVTYIQPIANSRCWMIAYDKEAKVFYLQYTRDGVAYIGAFDRDFNQLDFEVPLMGPTGATISDIYKFPYPKYDSSKPDEVFAQQTTVINGQLLTVFYSSRKGGNEFGSNGAFIAQYNFADKCFKKVWRLPNIHPQHEPECMIEVDGRVLLFSNIGIDTNYVAPQISVSELSFDKRVSGDSGSIFSDIRLIGTTNYPTDLNKYLTPGVYYCGVTTAANISHRPQPTHFEDSANGQAYAFMLYVLPFGYNGAVIQIVLTSHGETFYRTCLFGSEYAQWYGWGQLTQTLRDNSGRSGTIYCGGSLTNSGKDIRFTVPFGTHTYSDARPTPVINNLKIAARQPNGSYIHSGNRITIVDNGSTVFGYTVTATSDAWGINVSVTRDTEWISGLNNVPLGLDVLIEIRYLDQS